MPALKEPKKIDVRQAAGEAGAYLKKLYPTLGSFSLEEVELSEDGNYWLITLGVSMGLEWGPLSTKLQVAKTKYKVFKVDAKTGEVISMKIRKLE